jgi:hypothetical protein
MSNYVNWITNQKFIIDDEFAREALIKYLIGSFSRQGPEYSISKLPNWIEDLPMEAKEDSAKILGIFKTEHSKLLKENLFNLREYLPKKSKKFRGRNVTLEGQIVSEQEPRVENKDGVVETLEDYLEKNPDKATPEDKTAFRENAKRKVEEELEEEKTKGEIIDYRVEITKDGKLKTKTTGKIKGTLGDFKNDTWVEKEFIGFDVDNEDKVEALIREIMDAKDFLKNRIYLDADELKTEFKWERKGGEFKYTLLIKGDPKQNLREAKKFKKYGKLVESAKQKDMSFANPKELHSTRETVPISLDEAGKILGKSDNVLEKWFMETFGHYIFDGLKEKRALSIKYVNDIRCTGVLKLHPDDDNTTISSTFRYLVETQKSYDIERTEEATTDEFKDTERVTESRIGEKVGTGISAKFQYKTLLYNPLRKDFSEHIGARLERLEEVGIE